MSEPMSEASMTRAESLFLEHRTRVYKATDRVFLVLMPVQWLAAILLAIWLSPYAWAGKERAVHAHVYAALVLGGAITSLPVWLILRDPGKPITRYAVACAQMLWSALLIHLTGGRVETHFHVFG